MLIVLLYYALCLPAQVLLPCPLVTRRKRNHLPPFTSSTVTVRCASRCAWAFAVVLFQAVPLYAVAALAFVAALFTRLQNVHCIVFIIVQYRYDFIYT